MEQSENTNFNNNLTLKYSSEPKIYGFKVVGTPYSETIGNGIISECFSPNHSYNNLQEGLGDYFVSIESQVNQKSEIIEKYDEFSELARNLDRAWMYTCGHPLTKKHFSISAPHIIPIDGSIQGWDDNIEILENKFKAGKYRVDISFKHLHFATYDSLPLSNALRILDLYSSTKEVTKILIEHHYQAHKAENGYSMLFFLARGLELARALLPGKNKHEKTNELHSEVRQRLYESFDSVFKLSNNRFEIRHIVKNPNKLELHPKMNDEETTTFIHDAELIIRSVVCSQLDIELLLPSQN